VGPDLVWDISILRMRHTRQEPVRDQTAGDASCRRDYHEEKSALHTSTVLGSRNRGHTGFSLDIFRPKYLEAYEEGFRFRKSQARIPVATLHKILRNRIYTGEFEYGGVRYKGTHEPLVDLATWQRVQEILDGRHLGKHRKVTHSFAYSGLIKCGHCGCSLVAELKKGRYVYYHCTGYRGKCGETYTPEKTLAEQFAAYFQELVVPAPVLEWLQSEMVESDQAECAARTSVNATAKRTGTSTSASRHALRGPPRRTNPAITVVILQVGQPPFIWVTTAMNSTIQENAAWAANKASDVSGERRSA
jgi:hypothetical protein